MNQQTTLNHLAQETSPYLLQHQHNPVDWHPWGKTALELAKNLNKPILLSIGYSACHWCHVMAHESFEDPETAALMNKLFVNIKVDREERPDLDKIYQAAHSLLTQRAGGWPLTVFLTPDEHMPFFAGTYFPNTEKYGMPAFPTILSRVADAFITSQINIKQQNEAIRDVFKQIHEQNNQTTDNLSARPIDIAKNQLKQSFDEQYGGFGSAPKFPHPSNLEFAIQQWSHSVKQQQQDFELLNTATFTLEKMAQGGIFDQLAGGFCRYSVDNYWLIPHFEKMLYDNGPLLAAYATAHTIIETPLLEETALATANWMIDEMQSENGGFYSSMDADSENVEGKFYVWSPDEVRKHIDTSEYKIIAEYFGLDQPANFEEKLWHLYQATSVKQLAEKYDTDIHDVRSIISKNKKHLLSIRNHRTPPGRDYKILASWNALAIKGLSVAGRVFNQEKFIQSAVKATQFIIHNMWQNNRLYATHKNGKTQHNAYLDDYAYLIDAIIELLQSHWNTEHLNFACELANDLIEHFEHKECGGFYFTRDDHERLIIRQKNYPDEAMPSGNGVAAKALLKLGYLLSDTKYINAAERTLKAAFESMSQSPVSHCTLLQALDIYLNNGYCTVIIRGSLCKASEWQTALNQKYLSRLQHFYLPNTGDLPEALAEKKQTESTCAYICDGMSCSAPVYSFQDLLKAIP